MEKFRIDERAGSHLVTPLVPSERIQTAFILPWKITGQGGVNEVVRNLIQGMLLSENIDPVLIENDWDARTFRSAGSDGFSHFEARFRSPVVNGNELKGKLSYLLFCIPDVYRWSSWLRSRKVRVVNAHYLNADLVSLAILKRLLPKSFVFVLSVHGADIGALELERGLKAKVGRFILNSADRIVACSRAMARRAECHVAAGRPRVECIHNGCDISQQDIETDWKGILPDHLSGNYIVNVATYEKKKGQDVLLRAFAERFHSDTSMSLVLIGRKTSYLRSLVNLARDLGIEHRVCFLTDLGHQKTLTAIAGAALFVLPSRREPFGIVLLEAALLKVPVVASRVDGVPEVVGDDYRYLVAPDDVAALGSAIIDILADQVDRRSAVNKLHGRAKAIFSWKAALGKYESLFVGEYARIRIGSVSD